MSELDRFETLVRARRTSLVVDRRRPVDETLVERLCALATWAPNHKRTWPWRFAVFRDAGRAKLGAAFADDMLAAGQTDDARLDKTRTKYERAPVIVLAGSAHHDDPHLDEENRAAVAAGVQNVLLGATAAGLASFWSSPPVVPAPSVNALAGWSEDVTPIGVIYLGWPAGAVETPARPGIDVPLIE